MQVQVRFGFIPKEQETERILCKKNTQILSSINPKELKVVKNEALDPSKILDLSKGMVMPVFNQNQFRFNLGTEDLRNVLHSKSYYLEVFLYMNNHIVASHTLNLQHYI